jgi:hypothetical protein
METQVPPNPFHTIRDRERYVIWERLVRVDCEAFVAGDWAMIENDFDRDHFEGVRCANSADPDDWRLALADVDAYRDSWLDASRQFRAKRFANGITHRQAIFARTHLAQIEIAGSRALCHKKFRGDVKLADGTLLGGGNRQTLYRLHRRADSPWGWRIVGFLGQLPLQI